MNGVSTYISKKLESCGIIVNGERISDDLYGLIFDNNSDTTDTDSDDPDDQFFNKSLEDPNIVDLTTQNISNISKLNLDVTAMLAYCSSVTNGSAALYDFDVPVLKQQAEWERLRPQKPILDAFFEGTNIYGILFKFT